MRAVLFWLMVVVGIAYPFAFYALQAAIAEQRELVHSSITDFCNVEGSHCTVRHRSQPPRPFGVLYLNI
jgi:hypothetical protein